MEHACCRIELFGGLRVSHGGRVITRFRTQKAASLLAYLAYDLSRVRPREVLCELLWPGADPATSKQRLSLALTSLRRQLEPPGISRGAVLVADNEGFDKLTFQGQAYAGVGSFNVQ